MLRSFAKGKLWLQNTQISHCHLYRHLYRHQNYHLAVRLAQRLSRLLYRLPEPLVTRLTYRLAALQNEPPMRLARMPQLYRKRGKPRQALIAICRPQASFGETA